MVGFADALPTYRGPILIATRYFRPILLAMFAPPYSLSFLNSEGYRRQKQSFVRENLVNQCNPDANNIFDSMAISARFAYAQ